MLVNYLWHAPIKTDAKKIRLTLILRRDHPDTTTAPFLHSFDEQQRRYQIYQSKVVQWYAKLPQEQAVLGSIPAATNYISPPEHAIKIS